jgi:hypothetical protein
MALFRISRNDGRAMQSTSQGLLTGTQVKPRLLLALAMADKALLLEKRENFRGKRDAIAPLRLEGRTRSDHREGWKKNQESTDTAPGAVPK